MKKAGLLLIAIISLTVSCRNGKEMKTDSGFRYILFTDSKGEKAQLGDYITMVMVYRNSEDSIMFDSRKNENPIRFRLEKIPFKGSYEDGLTYLAENDSARFIVSADSLYKYLYSSRSAEVIDQKKTGLMPGTFLTFDIKVLNIQTGAEAEEEMMLQMSKKENDEKVLIASYVEKNKIVVSPDVSGYYLIIHKKGNGEAVDSGRVVEVDYEGRFFNDSVFDGTKKSGQSYKFISGSHHVIKGWELAMKDLHAGDQFSLLVPSQLAYGEEGIQDPQTGVFIVPPFTPLIFDIAIISVQDVPAVSNK